MSTYSSLLALGLAACGGSGSSGSSDLRVDAALCKNGRVWNATLEECVESPDDASISDASINDAGYVQKYQGKLYGVLDVDVINSGFVTYDFSTGKLERLVDDQGSIVFAPSGSHFVANSSLSPNGMSIVSWVSFDPQTVGEVYLFDLHSGKTESQFSLLGSAHFAWKDNTDFYVGLTEALGNNTWKTRLYQKSLDGSFSDWLAELDGKDSIGAIAVGSQGNVEFRCRGPGVDPLDFSAPMEICYTYPHPYEGGFYYMSHSVRDGVPFTTEEISWPIPSSNDVYVPCSQQGQKRFVCVQHVVSGNETAKVVLTSEDKDVDYILFSPDMDYVLVNNKIMYNFKEQVPLGNFIPNDLKLDGQTLLGRDYDLSWFAWREN